YCVDGARGFQGAELRDGAGCGDERDGGGVLREQAAGAVVAVADVRVSARVHEEREHVPGVRVDRVAESGLQADPLMDEGAAMTTTRRVSVPRAERRRGATLMIVMVVIAVATVLGYAMVSASALQSQTAGNMKYVSTAEYLADSGAQLALYYLQNPSASPVAMPGGYYPGQTGVTFGSTVGGTADVTVTYNSTSKLYTVVSVGKATTAAGGTVNKTVTATVGLVTKFTQ